MLRFSPPPFRLKSTLSVLTLMGGVFLLGACTGGSKTGGGELSEAQNIFKRSFPNEPTTLNPITGTDRVNSLTHAYTTESLLTRSEETYEWKPALATAYSVSEDGTEFTFTLRQGVTWHDGKPVTAEDVKFSFDVIFDPDQNTAHMRPYYEGIKSVEIIDPKTVKFTARDDYFRNFDSAAGLSIVPKHVYDKPEEGVNLNDIIVGTGAYKLEKYDKGKRLVMLRNENWWGRNDPDNKKHYQYKRVMIRFVTDSTVGLEMFKKGDLDYLGLTNEEYATKTEGAEWGKDYFKVQAENSAPKSYGYVGFNLQKPMFQDQKVRLALAHLMNRDLMIKKFRHGMSLPATGPWYRQSEYANPDVEPIAYDPQKAIALLKEAGWADEDKNGIIEKTIDGKKTELSFTLLTANPDFVKYLTIYKEDAKKAGIDISLNTLEWNSFIQLIDEKNFDAVNLGWGGGAVDIDPKQIWHSSSATKGGSNFISYSNPEVDKLIDEARVLRDKAERTKRLREVYAKIAADVPYIFLFNDKFINYAHQGRINKETDSYKFDIGLSRWTLAR